MRDFMGLLANVWWKVIRWSKQWYVLAKLGCAWKVQVNLTFRSMFMGRLWTPTQEISRDCITHIITTTRPLLRLAPRTFPRFLLVISYKYDITHVGEMRFEVAHDYDGVCCLAVTQLIASKSQQLIHLVCHFVRETKYIPNTDMKSRWIFLRLYFSLKLLLGRGPYL